MIEGLLIRILSSERWLRISELYRAYPSTSSSNRIAGRYNLIREMRQSILNLLFPPCFHLPCFPLPLVTNYDVTSNELRRKLSARRRTMYGRSVGRSVDRRVRQDGIYRGKISLGLTPTLNYCHSMLRTEVQSAMCSRKTHDHNLSVIFQHVFPVRWTVRHRVNVKNEKGITKISPNINPRVVIVVLFYLNILTSVEYEGLANV